MQWCGLDGTASNYREKEQCEQSNIPLALLVVGFGDIAPKVIVCK